MVRTSLEPAARRRARVRCCRGSDVDAHLVARWERLEARALEPNPFLSPLFVLPALRNLDPDADVQFILVEHEGDGSCELIGLGVFEVRATRLLPFPHLTAYVSEADTFLTGMLVDADCAREALTSLFEFLASQPQGWQDLQFHHRRADSASSRMLSEVAQRFGKRWIGWEFERPGLEPADERLEDAARFLSKSRRQQIRRARRKLEALAPLHFEVQRGDDLSCRLDDAVEHLLRLEHQGWKERFGHSLRSRQAAESFFREVAYGFASQGRLFFTELRLGGEVIGSTSNLISGREAVAYRAGWDRNYANVGLGALQEVELALAAPKRLRDLDWIDGGTGDGSWLAPYWPGRRRVANGVFAGSHLTAAIATTICRLRRGERTWVALRRAARKRARRWLQARPGARGNEFG